MNEEELNKLIVEAQKNVDLWEQTVRERNKTARGFLSTRADKEDLHFAESKLRDAKSKLERLKAS